MPTTTAAKKLSAFLSGCVQFFLLSLSVCRSTHPAARARSSSLTFASDYVIDKLDKTQKPLLLFSRFF
jgi:hypothetical protein